MKQLILVSILSVFFTEPVLIPKAEKNKLYYFCRSRAKGKLDLSKKQVIQYTDITEFVGDESELQKLSGVWDKLIQNQCENMDGCTSDLYIHPTYEAAKINHEGLMKKFADTSIYVLKRRTF